MLTQSHNAKAKAIRLANLLSGKEADKELIEPLFNDVQNAAGNRRPPTENLASTNEDEHVAIYAPAVREGETYYVRDRKYLEEYAQWADIEEIAPKKKDAKRIVLLGESVARGYFFDPTYSCAKLLDSLLQLKQDTTTFDIIDLANAGMTMDGLRNVYRSSMRLDPDGVVIFAGNNWLPQDILSEEDLEEVAGVVERGNDFTELKNTIEGIYSRKIEDLLRTVGELAHARNIPVIFMIPEFNLKDWQAATCFDRCVLWPQNNIEEVLNAIQSGEEALRDGKMKNIKFWAKKIIRLSPTHPVGFELMAQYYQLSGDFAAAKKYLNAAKDSGLFRIGVLPRTFSIVREVLSKKAAKFNIHTIDMAPVLAQQAQNGIPGRELFMDYCHFSFDGLVLAMKKATDRILDIFDLPSLEGEVCIDPDPTVKAKAHFCAALHNAHYGPQKHVLEYHCNRAVANDPAALDWMQWYIELATTKLPWELNAAYVKLLKSKIARTYEGGLQLMQIYNILDIELVKAMANVLHHHRPGAAKYQACNWYLEHVLDETRRTNLLDTYYHKDSYKQFSSSSFYFQSFTMDSLFYFFANGEQGVCLDLTIRVPMANEGSSVVLSVNGSEIFKQAVQRHWTTFKLKIPSQKVVKGINHFRIHWPNILSASYRKHENESPSNFINRHYQPLIGEVHSLFAHAINDSPIGNKKR